MVARIGLAVSGVIVLGAVALGVWRVAYLEGVEVHVAHQTTLAEGAREGGAFLGSAMLSEGTHATFEVCADDPMEAERWAGTMRLQLALDGEVGIDAALDEELLARVNRDDSTACLVLGRGPVLADGEYVILAAFDEMPADLAEIPMRGRIVARRELEDLDLLVVVLIWLGSLLIVLFLAARPRSGERRVWRANAEDGDEERGEAPVAPKRPSVLGKVPGAVRPAVAVLVGLAGMTLFIFGHLFPPGAAYALTAGVALGVIEVGLAVALIGGAWDSPRVDALMLSRPPKRWWLWFPIAGLAGVVLFTLARLSTMVVPSTGTSNITMFVSWPSGMLSFAALAVVAPFAEEIFFRGFVYGALERYHRAAGFLGAWLLFVAFHAAQTWGEWGALTAIAVTGLGLTTLRAFSRSVLVAAVAHLVYNGLLAFGAFL